VTTVSVFRVKSGAWSRASIALAVTDLDVWEPGHLLGIKANAGIYKANASIYPLGFAEEVKSATPPLDETLGSGKATMTRGIGIFSTDRYTGAVIIGSLMVLDVANNCMKARASEVTPIIAVALGAGDGGDDEVDFYATGDMAGAGGPGGA